ncbi:MAG: hypothetical protein NTX85_04000 [Candidatus Nomurabacteria bacterium]|nr:hypothetical protein [Candidatus Nomurabacteria bacterium]
MTKFNILIIIVVPCCTSDCGEHYKISGELSSKGDKTKQISSTVENNKLKTNEVFTPTDNVYAKFLAENIYSNFTEIEELSDKNFNPYDASYLISVKLNKIIEPHSKKNATIIVSKKTAEQILLLKEFISFNPPSSVQPYEIYVFNRFENSIKMVAQQSLS